MVWSCRHFSGSRDGYRFDVPMVAPREDEAAGPALDSIGGRHDRSSASAALNVSYSAGVSAALCEPRDHPEMSSIRTRNIG